MTLLFERWDGASWQRILDLDPGDPPGTISNSASGKREILYFEVDKDASVISRVTDGSDVDLGPLIRTVSGTNLQHIVTLHDGDTYELLVQTDRMASSQLCRFRHYAGKTYAGSPSSEVGSAQWRRPASASSSSSRQRTA